MNEVAGIVPQLNWNNCAGKTSGTIANLKDHAVNTVGSMSLTSNSGYRSQDTLSFSDPDFKMWFFRVRAQRQHQPARHRHHQPHHRVHQQRIQGHRILQRLPQSSHYPDNLQIDVDWDNDSSVDETLTGLAQWGMPEYDQTRPEYDYTDATGAAQFHHVITIPAGYPDFSLTLPIASGNTKFVVSGIQIVALPSP